MKSHEIEAPTALIGNSPQPITTKLQSNGSKPTARVQKQPSAEGLRVKGRALGEVDHTETDEADGIAGPGAEAVGRATDPRAEVPGSAAQQPFLIVICCRINPGTAIIGSAKIV
jgi:hypothetical protein